ncbi:hypothetical protein ABPG72_008785 [Tetrahymena utriculariae]
MQNTTFQQRHLENQRSLFEENDDLLSNMSKLHNKIHQNNQQQEFQQKFQNESSSSHPQSVYNLDKVVKQLDIINQNKQKSREADAYQQIQAISPCLRFFDQSCSSRSMNRQNINDLYLTSRPFAQCYQNNQKFQNNIQFSNNEIKQQQGCNFSQQNSSKFVYQEDLNSKANKVLLFQGTQFDSCKYSIKEQIQQKECKTNDIQSNTNSIRFEKGIFLIKNLLPNLGQQDFKIKQRVKQFVDQLKFFYPKRNSNSLNEQICKTIDDKSFYGIKNLNSSIQGGKKTNKIKSFNIFLATEQKNRDKQEEDSILSMLSNKLRNEVVEEINLKIINKYSLFIANFSQKVIKEIIFLMEEIIVAPNEIIFKQCEVEDQSIYFVQSGLVEIFVSSNQEQSEKVLCQLQEDSMFGEISFFSGLPRTASARSLKLSTIYQINRQKFLNLLMKYEEDFERYKMIQELIIFQQNYKCLYSQCFSCKQLGHSAINCPKSHLNIDKQFLILKNNFSTFQERGSLTKFMRKQNRSNYKNFALINQKICQQLKEDCKNYNSFTQLLYQSDNERNNLSCENMYQQDKSNLSDENSQSSNNSTVEKYKYPNTLSNIKISSYHINDQNNTPDFQSIASNEQQNEDNKKDQNQINVQTIQENLNTKNQQQFQSIHNDQINQEIIGNFSNSYNILIEPEQLKANLKGTQQNKTLLSNMNCQNIEQFNLFQKNQPSLQFEDQNQISQHTHKQKSSNNFSDENKNIPSLGQDNEKQITNSSKRQKTASYNSTQEVSKNKIHNSSNNFNTFNSLNQIYQNNISNMLQNPNLKNFEN